MIEPIDEYFMSLFQDLLEKTAAQDQPQRLMFLFAQAQAKNSKKSKQHQHGTISPVMCVDKLPEQLTSFSALTAEADAIEKNWNFVFIASLSGEQGQAPSTEQAEPFLNKMANDVEMGNQVDRYIILDRDEQPIELAPH
jgi:hypothetical protein